MTMGFKLQIVSCKFPSEILDVTENHINSVSQLEMDPTTRDDLNQFYKTFQTVT
jgi:hypothetical protein